MNSCTSRLALLAGIVISQMSWADHALETIVVVGKTDLAKAELEHEKALTPGGVTVVDSAELSQRNVSNLGDLLRYVPGVWTASGSTGDSTYMSSRGSNLDGVNYDGNGIKLLQDGLPVTAADGNNHNRDVNPLNARYATVARGANALTYGASTLGGAIDVISPTARNAETHLAVDGGSHGLAQVNVTAGVVEGDLDALVTVDARRSDGYRDHHDQERESLYTNAGWQFSEDVRTRLYYSYINNDQELPGPLTRDQWKDNPEQANAGNVVGNYLHNVELWRMANKTEWDINENSSLSVGISYEEQDLYHPIVWNPFFKLLIDTDQRNVGTALRYNLRKNDHDLLVGFNYGQTEVEGGNYNHEAGHRTTKHTQVDNDADSLELFVMDRWKIASRWVAVYGAQAVSASREVRNIAVPAGTVRNPKGDYHSINPRAGLIYQLTPAIELFGNLSKLYEAPTLYELEDDVQGNEETLDAMHGTVLELGTRGTQLLEKDSRWYWDLTLYYAQLQDEILSMDDPLAPGTSLATNVDDTIHAGVEALFGASFTLGDSATHRIEPLLNITYNDFHFDGDDEYGNNELPVAPRYAIKGEILYRHANGFFAGPTFDIVDERYADFSNDYTVDSYELLGLRTGLSRDNWEVYGDLRNLTDEEYIGVVSVKDQAAPNDAILQPGESRSVYVGFCMQY